MLQVYYRCGNACLMHIKRSTAASKFGDPCSFPYYLTRSNAATHKDVPSLGDTRSCIVGSRSKAETKVSLF